MDKRVQDYFVKLTSCRNTADIDYLWQNICTSFGYVKSGIVLVEWRPGEVLFPSFKTNWESETLNVYFDETFYLLDLSVNPLRKPSALSGVHIDHYDARGKHPRRVTEFLEFVEGLDTPGQISIPVQVCQAQRLCFNAWSEEGVHGFRCQLRANGSHLLLCALASAPLYMKLMKPVDRASQQSRILSPRERECCLWISRGEKIWDVSCRLGISVKTVEMHLSNARSKYQAKTTVELIVRAILLGDLKP